MTPVSTFFSLALALILCGCSSVTLTRPLEDAALQRVETRFEGIWLLNDETLHVRFAADGTARLAGLDWHDDDFRPVRGEMVVVKGTKDNLLSVRFQDDDEQWPDRWFLAKSRFTDQGDLLVWPAIPAPFAAAVSSGRLSGSVVKDQTGTEVVLTSSTADLLAFLASQANATLFDYQDPMVLKKIKDVEDEANSSRASNGTD